MNEGQQGDIIVLIEVQLIGKIKSQVHDNFSGLMAQNNPCKM